MALLDKDGSSRVEGGVLKATESHAMTTNDLLPVRNEDMSKHVNLDPRKTAGIPHTPSPPKQYTPRRRVTNPSPRNDWKQRQRQRKEMDFQNLLAGTPRSNKATPPPNELTPPRSGATPPHVRAGLVNTPRRVRTSPAKTQTHSRPAPPFSVPKPQVFSQQRRQTTNMPSAPSPFQQGQQYTRHVPAHRQSAVQNPFELRVCVKKVPQDWSTLYIHQAFEHFGNISRIDIRNYDPRTNDVFVNFQPTPKDISWVGRSLRRGEIVLETSMESFAVRKVRVACDPTRELPERISVPLQQVEFGVMRDESTMLVIRNATKIGSSAVVLGMDLYEKALFVYFPVQVSAAAPVRQFRFRINPAQVKRSHFKEHADGSLQLTIMLDHPPMVFRKTTDLKATHEEGSTLWDERQTWYRQTDIDHNPRLRNKAVQLYNEDCIVEVGRWLTYSFVITREVAQSSDFQDVKLAMRDHNILPEASALDFKHDSEFFNKPHALWSWLDGLVQIKPAVQNSISTENSCLADLQQLATDTIHLPFPVRYQLEVCLSNNILHEANIKPNFLKKLASLDPARAVKVLEKAADLKERYFEPDQIIRLQYHVSIVEKRRPAYCTKIPSVVVTPTTMYFATPVVEPSNRVIRQFKQYEDRFLRVKFTDERYRGALMSQDDRSMDEVFSRVSRTMTHGIRVGDRHYEFLAFGSSQFRENGAYFFASTNTLTAEMIRQWMGNFSNIKVIAKYCARLGQCFTTTRAIPHAITVEKIPDVERNGYCFTDGVGKMSPFLAQMIAHHYGEKEPTKNYPSMVQFRMAGCKGVLAVDPTLKNTTVQIRPSQEKFSASFHGLEICRTSQFSTACLNMQLILVLSALGISDDVFLEKLRVELQELGEAMTNSKAAKESLTKRVDLNAMTSKLAEMVVNGFMDSEEPFLISCLRLWRAWSLKYLKEKARIPIEHSAFVLGGTDETQTLKGHLNEANILKPGIGRVEAEKTAGEEQLPEIFLQIPESPDSENWKVITGICVLARNPSLHPGDVRVVRAVDVPALHHIKNVVILPQTGDRDLANMCSGGDLDGDDYMVIWDQKLIPEELNHAPMDYTGPTPEEAKGPVTVADITKFFVKHIKYDNLGRIAVAHRYWADFEELGVKDPRCLELAELHSKAVDFAKTGVEATMPKHLRVRQWPHWSEQKNKSNKKIYRSHKVLGKLFDEVKLDSFQPAWDLPFDERILKACEPSEQMLSDAKEVKTAYDEAVRRIMAQFGVNSEFEVWTTFALEHHHDFSDYKFAEKFGEVVTALRETYQDLCYEKAGTVRQMKDDEKLKPFLVAMYTVTAKEVSEAVEASKEYFESGGRRVYTRPMTFENMPFMSFPWIFERELGIIATRGEKLDEEYYSRPRSTAPSKNAALKRTFELLGDDYVQTPLPEVNLGEGRVREGDLLDLFHDDGRKTSPVKAEGQTKPSPQAIVKTTPVAETTNVQKDDAVLGSQQEAIDLERLKSRYKAMGLPVDNRVDEKIDGPSQQKAAAPSAVGIQERSQQGATDGDNDDGESEGEGGEVQIEFEESGLDKLLSRFE